MKTKRKTLAFLFVGVLALAGCSSSSDGGAGDANAGEDPTVTLTLGHPFAENHLIQKEVLEPFAEEVLEATDGTVTIEIVPGGALGAGDVIYENVISGAQDMGFGIHGYTPGRFPLTEVMDLPFLFERAEQGTQVLWDAYEEFPELQEEYDQVKVLGLWANDVGEIWTTEKQVTKLEDMRGLTLRGPGPTQIELINALGGSGVVMPGAEVYDGLERGVLDGVMTAGSGPVTLNIIDLLDYALICHCYTAANYLVMNQADWDQLSAGQQEAIDKITGNGRELSLKAARAFDGAYDSGVDEIIAGGVELTNLEGAELERWQDVGDEVVESWLSSRSGTPAQELYDFVKEAAKTHAP